MGPVTASWSCRTEHARSNNNKLRPLPQAAVNPVKTKTPSLSADDTLHRPDKNLLRAQRAVTDGRGPVWRFLAVNAEPHARARTRWDAALVRLATPKSQRQANVYVHQPPPREKHSISTNSLQLEG